MSNNEALGALTVQVGAPAEVLTDRFDRFGAVLVEQLVSPTELAAMRRAVSDVIRMEARLAGVDLPPDGELDIMDLETIDHSLAATVYDVVNSHPEVFRLVGSEELRRAADVLINGSVTNELVTTGFQLRMDLPGNQSELLGWHRDCDYFQQFPSKGVVLWCPLFDVTRESGGISVVPENLPYEGLRGVELEKHWPGRRKPHRVYEIEDGDGALAGLAEPVRIECKAGDGLFFSLTSPHRSEPNRSSGARWTLQYRYFSASAVAARKLDRAALSQR